MAVSVTPPAYLALLYARLIDLAFYPISERVEHFRQQLCVRPAGSGRDVERVISALNRNEHRYGTYAPDLRGQTSYRADPSR